MQTNRGIFLKKKLYILFFLVKILIFLSNRKKKNVTLTQNCIFLKDEKKTSLLVLRYLLLEYHKEKFYNRLKNGRGIAIKGQNFG